MFKKALGAFAAIALVVSVSVPAVSAMSASAIEALLIGAGVDAATAATLAAALGDDTTSSTSGSCALKNAPDMTLGAQGANVIELQNMLIASGDLVIPAGVSKGYFGVLTQSALAKYQARMNISPAAGYFGSITRGKIVCDTTSTPDDKDESSSKLKGGAGDIVNIDKKTSGTETTVGEGREESVLGFEIEADDNSDLEITSIRLVLTPDTDGSTRLTRYAEEILIELEGDEVGSIDASDFSRSGATHTGTISLKNAIVDAGDSPRFNVVFVAKDSIDSDDQDNTIEVELDRIRYEDATGAILSENVSSISSTVSFEDSTENDDLKLQTSTENPSARLIKVETNKSSEEYEVFAFKLRSGDDSSDVSVLGVDVDVEITNPSSGIVFNTEDVIKEIWLEVDGVEYEDWEVSVTSTTTATSSSETATYSFTIDEGDLEIESGDRPDVKVFVIFNEQDGKYSNGTDIDLTVKKIDIDVENIDGDQVTVTGATSVSSETHTVLVEGVFAEKVSESYDREITGDNPSNGTISITFEVTPVGSDLVLADDGTDITYTLSGATEEDAIISVEGKTASAGDFTIGEDDSREVTLSLKFASTTGFVKLEVTKVDGTSVNNIVTKNN